MSSANEVALLPLSLLLLALLLAAAAFAAGNGVMTPPTVLLSKAVSDHVTALPRTPVNWGVAGSMSKSTSAGVQLSLPVQLLSMPGIGAGAALALADVPLEVPASASTVGSIEASTAVVGAVGVAFFPAKPSQAMMVVLAISTK